MRFLRGSKKFLMLFWRFCSGIWSRLGLTIEGNLSIILESRFAGWWTWTLRGHFKSNPDQSITLSQSSRWMGMWQIFQSSICRPLMQMVRKHSWPMRFVQHRMIFGPTKVKPMRPSAAQGLSLKFWRIKCFPFLMGTTGYILGCGSQMSSRQRSVFILVLLGGSWRGQRSSLSKLSLRCTSWISEFFPELVAKFVFKCFQCPSDCC